MTYSEYDVGRDLTKTKIEAESYYDILANEDDELLITIKSRESFPQDPVIVYAGGDHALLLRNTDLTIILDFINPGVRGLLSDAKEVLIAELKDGSISSEYVVPLKYVKELPLPEIYLPGLTEN